MRAPRTPFTHFHLLSLTFTSHALRAHLRNPLTLYFLTPNLLFRALFTYFSLSLRFLSAFAHAFSPLSLSLRSLSALPPLFSPLSLRFLSRSARPKIQ